MIRVLSYGGGLDGFAILLKSIALGQKPDVVGFVDVADGTLNRANVDPGEWPSTYRHIREVVVPLCEREGIEFVWLDSDQYPVRDSRSLFAWMHARKQIPVAGPNRVCTAVAKVERFERWLADRWPGEPVEVWVGFEAGEEKRAANDPNSGTGKCTQRRNRFPLIEWGLCRCRCEAMVRELGYPVPRKSACVFCPYGAKGDWQTFARELPDDFAKVAELEAQKPPTSKGRKLSIMGYRTLKNKDGSFRGYKAPPLPEFIKGSYRRRIDLCVTCGQPRATKATGCDYLEAS